MLKNIIDENRIDNFNLISNDLDKKQLISNHIISKAEEEYLAEFPKRDSEKLRYEVEKIAELLVENRESNRYTNLLRKKASKNRIIRKVQNFKETKISILDYNNGKMKAEVTYKDLAKEYSLVLEMNTVSQGRLFVWDFDINKRKRRK